MRFQRRQLYWILTGPSFTACWFLFSAVCRIPEGTVKPKKTIDPANHLRDDDIKPEEFSTFPFSKHDVVKWFRSLFDSWPGTLAWEIYA
jgi:hypothetical protein